MHQLFLMNKCDFTETYECTFRGNEIKSEVQAKCRSQERIELLSKYRVLCFSVDY
jgi:hypothetical protein